jgi:peptide/nickel transport system substrate-binding protein
MVAHDRSGKPISTPGLSLRLIRNPNWRRDTDVRPAYLDEIDFRGGFADPRVLVDKVLGGRASVTSNFPPPPPVLQSVLSGPHRRQLSILEGSASLLLELNTTIPPLTDANVRLAIAAALDRRRMSLLLGPAVTPPADHYLMPRFLKAARQGGAAVAAPPVLADPAGSLALAHAYLRRAGYPSGRYTGSARLRFVGIAVEARPVTDLIDLELRSLGFKLDTTAVPPEVAFERCGRPRERVAMCFGNSVAIFDDPETMLGQFAGSQIKPESNPDPAQLNDPTVNAAIARASVVSQAGARARAWAGVERLILARMPAVPLVYENLPYFRSADVQDFVNGYTGLSDACWMRLARG